MTTSTKIKFILDRSGSMDSILRPTINGYNQYIQEQRNLDNLDATATLIQFDNQYEVHYADLDIRQVPDLTMRTFIPRGATALTDALGLTIADTAEEWLNLEENSRPRVLIILQTDGQENCSRIYATEAVRGMVIQAQLCWGWQFLFIGTGDAASTARTYGIGEENAISYSTTDKGVSGMFSVVSKRTAEYRLATTEED
jgi:hypothetical protein